MAWVNSPYNSVMRLTLIPCMLLAAMLMTACPGDTVQQGRGGPEQVQSEHETSVPADAPTEKAVDFLKSSLREPLVDDHVSLEDSWNIISRLPDATPFKSLIDQQVAQAGGSPGVQLVSAWLVTDPEAAKQYILTEARADHAAALQPLIRFPEIGTDILQELDLSEHSVDFQDACLLLVRNWIEPSEDLVGTFEQLAASPEPNISLRALGYLLRFGRASDEQIDTLRQAIRSEDKFFAAAAEGAKISRSEALATAFVPRLQEVPMGELDPERQWQSKEFYSAYALAYIPGRDATVIRLNLLNATINDLRWQARFGELMQGSPASFEQAALEEGVLNPELLACLVPPEAMHPALLDWYEKAFRQADEPLRFQLVTQLSRYNEHASEPKLRELVLGLLDDESSLVRGQAWLLAAQFAYSGQRLDAAALLESATEQGPVKAAAACYLLSTGGTGR